MRRDRVSNHNPLAPPDLDEYIQLAPGHDREAVEAYDNWAGNEQVPSKVKELIMILRIELSRRHEA